MQELRFDDQVVVITGAGRGLGREYGLLLASRGARVVVNDPGVELDGRGGTHAPADDVVRTIVAAGGEAVANFDPVGTEDAAQRLVAQAIENFGRIDVVVNNAGIFTPMQSFADTSPESFEALFRVHVMGTVHTTRAAWPHLVGQRYGRIINVASAVGYIGTQGRIQYGTAKGAIHGFTRTLSKDVGDLDIRVNAIAPGALTRPVTASTDNFPPQAAAAFSPALVAPAVAWLAHRDTTINGQVFTVMAGTTSQIVIGEASGFRHANPTPELLRDNAHRIFVDKDAAAPGLSFYDDGEEQGMALVSRYCAGT